MRSYAYSSFLSFCFFLVIIVYYIFPFRSCLQFCMIFCILITILINVPLIDKASGRQSHAALTIETEKESHRTLSLFL